MRALILLTFFLACSAPSCRTLDAPASDLGKPWEVDPSELPKHWPKSAELERAWGPPAEPMRIDDGKPTIVYSDPDDADRSTRVTYHGSEQPREIVGFDGRRAVDGQLTAMGQTVDFYSSGNEIAEISTQALRLSAPDGWSGWFTFTFSAKEDLGGRDLPAFAW